MAGNFEGLLAELEAVVDDSATLAKSVEAKQPDDKTIAAAADEAGEGEGNPEDKKDEDEGDEIAKALASGKAIDATDLIKSLQADQDETAGVLAKAVTAFTGALQSQAKTIKGQGELIKSLQAEVASLGSQGRGRRALLNVMEKPDATTELAKSEGALGGGDGKISKGDLLAKSEAAWKAKAITGAEFTRVDVCLRHGNPIEADLLKRIAAA